MTPEEAIQVADEVLLARAGSALTDIQRMILRESLADKGYEHMAGYAPQHIKNEGKKLWDLLSQALGETVSKKNFKGALEKRLKLGVMVPQPPQPSNYDEQIWAGRDAVVSNLLPKLQEKIRLLWLTGISGIGKTALGECLASQAWKRDPSFQWVYLEILEGTSTDFASVAADLLAKLGERNLDLQERNNPDLLAKRLMQKLQAHPYWIQLDALERLLSPEQPTEFRDVYWTTFLQRCLTETNLVSRLVLTAQAFPTALAEFGDRYTNVWAEVRLGGLSDADQRLEFFAKRGLVVETPKQDILTRIAQIYEGHPLVLKVIAEDILKEFAGNIDHYWQVNQQEFEQVARELQDAQFDETEYNEALDHKVRDRIRKSLEQLPADTLDLLCRSSVFRRPVPKKFWLAMIGDRAPSVQKVAYRVLGDRALIEKEGTDIRQHNLIRSVAYDLLKPNISIWHEAERQAAHLWLTAYEPDANAADLEIVHGYLEAFGHYCEVGDWNTAKNILRTPLNTPTKSEFHWQLGLWGLYQQQIELCQRILNKLDFETDSILLNTLGIASRNLNKYQESIVYHGKDLEIAQKLSNRKKESAVLSNLGITYASMCDYRRAAILFRQSLEIHHEIDDQYGEGRVLTNLGHAYLKMGDYQQAVDCFQQSLIIAQKLTDRQAEASNLCNIGLIFDFQGRYKEAVNYAQKSLEIMREIEDRRGEGRMLNNIASAYIGLGDYQQANDYLQQRLVIAQKMKDRYGEATALGNLGAVYEGLCNYSQAIKYHEQHLEIAHDIKDTSGEARALGNLGVVYGYLEDYQRAINYHHRHLNITRKIDEQHGEAIALGNLGKIQMKLRQYKDALENSLAGLEISQKIGSKSLEAEALKNLAELHQAMGEVEGAQQYCQKALVLATELGIPLKAECEALLLKMQS